MNDFISLMWKPLTACLILTGIHAYLGIHVIERQVIFVDLALAQIAALGATAAILFGFDLHNPITYWFSLGATFFGAVAFSLTRTRKERIPQEAIIGIVYAVSAAAAILILSHTPEGDEHIRQMLVGNVLLVDLPEIMRMAALYSTIGVIHWIFRKKFILISTAPEEAFRRELSVKKWDLLFYLTFGFVVTSSVEVAGVLLVFSYLIVPSVAAMLLFTSLKKRLLAGWLVGMAASFLGIGASYLFDLPTGATIISTFGVLLILIAVARKCWK